MAKTIKGRKFVATAATAALVASAIVPVASASTEFTDSAKISDYAKDAVAYLVGEEIITGNPDGSFNPQGNITRAQAATIFTKALALDTTGTENFSDVASADWFYSAVVGVTKAGIVNGLGDGTFGPNANLTRAQAAKMIVGAYGLTGSADLSAYTDAKGLDTWASEALATAVENGVITGTSKTTLAPNANITRQDFAVIVKRAIDAVDPALVLEDALKELATAKAALVETVTEANVAAAKAAVTAAEEAVAAATKAVAAAVKAEVVTEAEAKAATVAIEAVTVAVTTAKAAVKKYEDSLIALEVVSVTASNAKEIVIDFNVALDELTATALANYELEVAGSTVTFAVDFDEDAPKQVTLVATAPIVNNAAVKVTVSKKVLSEALVGLKADYTKVFVSNDVVAPSITKVSKSGNNVVVTFSEDIASTIGLVKFNGTTYAAGSYVVSGNTLTITNAATGLAAGEYELVLNNVADLVPTTPNTTGVVTAKLTVVADSTVPAISSVTQVGDNKIKVKFNKAVTPVTGATPVVVSKNGYPLTLSAPTVNASSTEYTYTLTATGSVLVYDTNSDSSAVVVAVTGFKDANGTITNAFTQSLTLSKDKAAPVVLSRFNTITDTGTSPTVNEVFDIYFDEVITLAGTTAGVVLIDKNGIRQAVSGVSVVADTNGDNKILRVASTAVQTGGVVNAGAYTISLPAGFVADTSLNTNPNAAITATITKSASAAAGVSATASAASNVISVVYGSAMSNTATSAANYLLDGKALPTGSVVYFASDNLNVKIELPTSSVAVTGGGVLTINDAVVSTTANKVASANKNISIATGFVDNIKPVLASAKKLSVTEVELTFSEAVTAPAGSLDDFIVTINGVTVTPTAIAAGTAGNKLVLTLPTYNTAQTVNVSVTSASGTTIEVTDGANFLTRGTSVVAQ